MPKRSNKINVYLEMGQKKTFAGSVDWPGWCRSGREEGSALQALLDYGPRYARVVRATKLGFQVPEDLSDFVVVERLKGNATTDFGAPGIAPSADSKSVSAEELHSLAKILNACSRALDASVNAAQGASLRTGPRGGGRQTEGILQHVVESNGGYLSAVGWKAQQGDANDFEQSRQAILEALKASARGEIPAKGPRGGTRWSARYFARRVAWHILDHAWEIEDRLSDE